MEQKKINQWRQYNEPQSRYPLIQDITLREGDYFFLQKTKLSRNKL